MIILLHFTSPPVPITARGASDDRDLLAQLHHHRRAHQVVVVRVAGLTCAAAHHLVVVRVAGTVDDRGSLAQLRHHRRAHHLVVVRVAVQLVGEGTELARTVALHLQLPQPVKIQPATAADVN
eukprot:1899717-Pyramimonas_sp.AAC.1